MSKNIEAEQRDLQELLQTVTAKERQGLRLSILFTVIVLGIGFVWIAYSVREVNKLQNKKTDLEGEIIKDNDEITNQKKEISQYDEVLRKYQSAVIEAETSFEKIHNRKVDCIQEAQAALTSLHDTQRSVQRAESAIPRSSSVGASPSDVSLSVPKVTGIPLHDAEVSLRSANLSATWVYQHAQGTAGIVVYQDPIQGTTVRRDRKVKLYVISDPTQSVVIPDFVGLNFDRAEQTALKIHLALRKVDQEGQAVQGTVLRQNPRAGTRAQQGSEVSLYIIPAQH
jgi:hypothetical protein